MSSFSMIQQSDRLSGVQNYKWIQSLLISHFSVRCRMYKGCFIFFQIGMWYEFYQGQSRQAKRVLNLKKGRVRKGLGEGRGFPCKKLRSYMGEMVVRHGDLMASKLDTVMPPGRNEKPGTYKGGIGLCSI